MSAERAREIRQLQKAKEKAQRSGSLVEEAAACNQLGEILASHGRYEEALEEHRRELWLLEAAGDSIGCAVAHRKIGERLAELEDYEAALKHQHQHLELACSLSDHTEQQRAWATIGRTYMFVADSCPPVEAVPALREAERAFRTSLAIVEEKLEGAVAGRELSEMRSRLYLNLGLVYDSLKDQAKCGHYIKKSIFLSEQAHLCEDLYRAYFNLGNIHLREGEHSRALRCLDRARDCARRMKEKAMESECCSSTAQVLLSLGDFVAAKRSLKKAYVLGSRQPWQRDLVRCNLRYATKVSRLQEALEEAASDPPAALALCEQLGDAFSKHGDYGRAVEYYKKQLGYAEALRRPAQELAVIHVSLATTFGDLKEHAQAVRHYQEELALHRGNALEEGKTWLNIALAKEEVGEPRAELEACFRTALRRAEEAGEPRLQKQILQHLHSLQQRHGSAEAPATMARLQSLAASGGDSAGEEEEELESSGALDESDLELSESDGEEDELDGYSKSVPGRRRISKWNRRNDRGETPLHRACIEGDLRRAQLLVKQGHPLNPRDYCGWTPLHEACNHGHLEIVRLLLERGAAIDDAGGPGCEGITPLHDALSCGHFDVAELLVQRGAAVTLRNAKGLTPLGTLAEWVSMYSRDLDQETRQRCRAMERLLKETAAGRGEAPPGRPWVLPRRRARGLSSRAAEALPPPWGPGPSSPPRRGKLSGSGVPLAAPAAPPLSPDSQLFDAELSEPLIPRRSPPGSEGPPRKAPAPGGTGTQGRGSAAEPPRAQRDRPEQEDDAASPLRPVKKRQRVLGADGSRLPGPEPAAPGGSQAEYEAAIRGLGSAKSLLGSGPEATRDPAPRPALIPAEQYVEDDWLEDDLGAARGARKRLRRELEEPAAASEESTGPESDGAAPCPPWPRRRRTTQSRLTRLVQRTRLGRSRERGAPEAAGPPVPRGGAESPPEAEGPGGSGESPPQGPTQVRGQGLGRRGGQRCPLGLLMLPSPPPWQPPSLSAAPAPLPAIRVRVRVQDNVFLIPVPQSESRAVGWLAEQAAQRYYQTCGLLPRLTLKKEGALLAPQDLVGDVLQSNEEVLAEVQSWDLPPLAERYRKACQSLAVEPHPLLLKVTERQEQSPAFSTGGLPLRPPHLPPLLRALKLQAPLRQLRLAGSGLGDGAATELLATLGTVPGLVLLDLSGNRLSAQGLQHLVPQLPGPAPFQSLEELDLSLNPLGDAGCRPLALLLQACPVLTTLRLRACGFAAGFLRHCRLSLAGALAGAGHLKTLVLSCNALGAAGLEQLLRSLPCGTLSHLELGSVAGAGAEALAEAVRGYLTQEGCALTHLTLSGNRLDDEAVRELARCLPACPALVSLDLSANPGISAVGLRALLSALAERCEGLRYLSLAGCSVEGPLDGAAWAAAAASVRDLRLCSRRVSRSDQRAAGEAWRGPPGTAPRVLARHRKLFCESL
ncbi:tonsoku-like protein [Apteryx mantelli]|uniref:Tonsoku-like protein n=1 Tax=Apteryx mantelli TaxID=2696672 RepID=A0ABM4E7I4_9AVES